MWTGDRAVVCCLGSSVTGSFRSGGRCVGGYWGVTEEAFAEEFGYFAHSRDPSRNVFVDVPFT